MLTKKVEDALNNQIEMEAYASNSYLSMASWCEAKGLRGSAAFFYAQSDEEREHMLKLVKYVNKSGGCAVVGTIKGPAASYKSLDDIFETSLAQEQGVTKSINKLVELCFSVKDHASYNFLQWYVEEQHEEESLFRSILDLITLAGKDGRSLLILDNEIAKIRAQEEAESKS